MARGFWDRLMRRRQKDVIERETERAQGSAQERHFATERFEDLQADEFVSEHLGGVELDRTTEDDPPRT
jgi:hypothetical protein